jgi:hypothetical protein
MHIKQCPLLLSTPTRAEHSSLERCLQVTMTDGNEEAVQNCKHNLQLNARHGRCSASILSESHSQPHNSGTVATGLHEVAARLARMKAQKLAWGSREIPADVVVAADVVYDADAVRALVKQLRLQLRPDHGIQQSRDGRACIAYVATAVRNSETLEGFMSGCEASGLHVSVVEHAQLGTSDPSSASRLSFCHCIAFGQGHRMVLHKIL